MRVRWSDVIAISAISAGALFPVAVRDAVRGHDPRLTHVDVRPHLVLEVQPEACVEERVLEVLEERRDEIRTRVEQMRFEAVRMRTEADRVRERMRAELDRHRSELAASSAASEELRRGVVEAATSDLIRMSVARIEAENAMTDALVRLEAQISGLETRLGSGEVDAEDGKKKRKRRRGPPCRRPGRRHPGR